jgi:adenosine deaminase
VGRVRYARRRRAVRGVAIVLTFPKIELHVHLEGTIRPGTLIQIARRNDLTLPASTEVELADLYRYRDFTQFLSVWATWSGIRSPA